MRKPSGTKDENLENGTRLGRYIVRDIEGRCHAPAATSVLAVYDDEGGDIILLLAGGRALRVRVALVTVLAWLDGRG